MGIFTLRDLVCESFVTPNVENLHGFEIGDVVSPILGCDSFPMEYYGSEGMVTLQDDIEGLIKIKFSEEEICVGKAADVELVRKFNEINVGPFDIDSIALLREQYYYRKIGKVPLSLIDQLIDGYFSVPYFIDKSVDSDSIMIAESRQKIAASRIIEFWDGMCSAWGIGDLEQRKFLINTSIESLNPSRGSAYGGMEPQVLWDLKNKFEDLISSILKVGHHDPEYTESDEDLIEDLSRF